MSMPEIRKYSCLIDIPDSRDYLFSKLKAPSVIPSKVDLREFCSKIENQSALGSCVGNASASALEFLEIKEKANFFDASRLFIYYNARVLEGTEKEDAGCTIRDAIKSLSKEGVTPETEWPYNIRKYADKPPKSCYQHALNHKITSYHRILGISEMKQCLADGFPFVISIKVYEGFETVGKDGKVNMPKSREKYLGNHAVCAVGYDDSTKRFLFRNSWGTSYGDKGYFTLPYDYLEKLSFDCWTIRVMQLDGSTPIPNPPKKPWYQPIINFLKKLFKK